MPPLHVFDPVCKPHPPPPNVVAPVKKTKQPRVAMTPFVCLQKRGGHNRLRGPFQQGQMQANRRLRSGGHHERRRDDGEVDMIRCIHTGWETFRGGQLPKTTLGKRPQKNDFCFRPDQPFKGVKRNIDI